MTRQDEFVEAIRAAIADDFKEIIRTEVKDCACPLNAEDRQAVPLLYDVFKDLGDGNLGQGIRRSRNLFKFVGDIYNRKNMATGAVIVMVILGAFGMLGTWIWAGFIAAIRGN